MPDMELLELLQKSQEQNMGAFEVLADSIGKMLKKQEMKDSVEEEMKRKMEEEKMNKEREELEKAKWDALSKSLYDYINKSVTETSNVISKTVSDTVLAAVKQVYAGMDVDATKAHNVDGGDVKLPPQNWPMSTREHKDVDKEEVAKVRADTKSVQNPIQAMQKHDVMYKDEDMPLKPDETSEYPVEEDENKDKPTLEDMQKAYAQLKALKDEVTNIKKSYQKDVEKAVDTKLKTFGIHEEKSFATKIVKSPEIGASEVPIQKSIDTTKDPADVLKKVRTADLMNEWLKSKGFALGGTSSVPQEVMINAS